MKELLQRMAKREVKAFEVFYDRYGKAFYSFAFCICKNKSEAESLIGDTFRSIWENADALANSKTSIFGTLISQIRYAALDRLRSRGFGNRRQDFAEMEETDVFCEENSTRRLDSVILSERVAAATRAWGRLSQEERDFLEGAYFQGMPQSQLSERFGLPPAVVRSRLRIGLYNLLKALRESIPGESVPITTSDFAKDSFREWAAAFVVGALDGSELEQFQSRIKDAGNAEKRIYNDLLESCWYLSLVTPQEWPSPRLKQTILLKVRPDAGAVREGGWEGARAKPPPHHALLYALGLTPAGFNRFLAAFFFLSTLCLAAYVYFLREQMYGNWGVMAQQRQMLVSLREGVESRDSMLTILHSKRLEAVVLEGTSQHRQGYGRLMWKPGSQEGLLMVHRLPDPPEGQFFRLWIFRDNLPVNGGDLSLRGTWEKPGIYRIPLVESDRRRINAFAITLESDPNATAPGGPTYLMGNPLL